MSLRIILLALGLVVAGLCAIDAAKAATTAEPTKAAVTKAGSTKKESAKKAKSSKKTTTKKTAKSKKTSSKAVKSANKVSSQKKATSGELQTDVKFDDSVLHGQYQTPDEALARVENEKGLNDLLGVRKHFKDRLTTASEQE